MLPYFNDEDTRPVFGKHNPYTYGVLPVLVVIRNDSAKTVKVQSLQAVWAGPNGDKVEATPAKDVRYLNGPSPARRDTGASRDAAQSHRSQESAGQVGDRGPRFRRPSAAAGSVGQRLFLFPDGISTRREPLSERAARSRIGAGVAVF